MEVKQIINGIDIQRIHQTVEAIKKNPEIAKFNFRAENKWIGGQENHTTVSDFYGACTSHVRKQPYVFVKDEPEVLLGNDKGANPVEYLLAGIAGCITTALVDHAAAKGVKIDSIESTLEGDIDLRGLLQIDPNVNPGYQGINISFKIKSDSPKEKLQELVELAKKSSPVVNTVTRPTPVNVTLT